MDSFSHTMLGAVIAKAGFRQRLGRYATAALAISALFPDTDFIFRFWGPFISLKMHRGFTHSFLGVFIAALFLALIFSWLTGFKRFWVLVGLCSIGGLSHLFFDLMTSFGTQIFYPFTTKRYALDWIFILDGVITLSLLLPLILMRGRPQRAAICARLGLAVVIGYIALGAVNHSLALNKFRGQLIEKGIKFEQLAALPRPFGPFRWSGLARAGDEVYRTQIKLLSSELEPLQRFASSAPNRYVLAARNLEEVKIYRWFARFPIETYTAKGEEHVVEYTDLRFRLGERRDPFLLRVILNKEGQLVRVEF